LHLSLSVCLSPLYCWQFNSSLYRTLPAGSQGSRKEEINFWGKVGRQPRYRSEFENHFFTITYILIVGSCSNDFSLPPPLTFPLLLFYPISYWPKLWLVLDLRSISCFDVDFVCSISQDCVSSDQVLVNQQVV